MSPADRAIAARDPWMPALSAVLGDGLTAVIHAGWCGAGPAPDAVRVRYLRYKPGGQLTAAVELRSRDQVRTALLLATSREATAKRDKLLATAERRGQAVLSDDPRRGVLLVPVAADRHLAGADRFLEHVAHLRPELRDAAATVLAYKPHRRLVVRLDVAGRPRAVVKAHHAERYPATVAALRWGDRRGDDRLPLPRLLAADDDHHLTVTAWTDGHALDQRTPDRHRATLRSVGKVLGRLHRRSPDGLPAADEDGADAGAVLRSVAVMRPDLVPTVRDLLATAPAPTGPRTPVHGDLSADQVVHADEHVALIDLDRTGCGHPAADLASWVAARLVADADAPLRLPAALWEGYRSVDGPATGSEVAAEIPRQVLSRLHEPFRHRRPGWSAHVERLVARCRTSPSEVRAS